jgi:putative membrane protein
VARNVQALLEMKHSNGWMIGVMAAFALAACGGETPEAKSGDPLPTETPPPPPSDMPPPAPGDTAEPSHGMSPTETPSNGGPSSGAGSMNDTMTPSGTPNAVAGSAPPMAPLTDEQIVAIANAANTGEIEEAKVAQQRAKNAAVKQFASMMVQHHSQAKQKDAALASKLKLKAEESPKSEAMTSEAKMAIEALKSVDVAAFDRAYIAAQIDAHQKVLDALDSQLIPGAKSPELRAELQAFRPRVESHLTLAKTIDGKLDAANASRPATGQPRATNDMK